MAWGEENRAENIITMVVEMCALDFHLFSDLETAVLRNVVGTSSLELGSEGRYGMGTPIELSSAIRRTWEYCPTSERIVEDISRLPYGSLG